MNFVPRKAARVYGDLFSLCRLALKLPQRIETLEFEAAIIAKQLMQTGHLKHYGRILVAALDTRAFAAGTPHRSFEFKVSSFESRALSFEFRSERPGCYDDCSAGESIYDLRFTIHHLRAGEMGQTILTNEERPRPHICLSRSRAAITMACSKLRLSVRE